MKPIRPAIALASAAAIAITGLAAAPAAHAVDPTSAVVISEVYGGGGNSGAPYRNDFIELYNNSDSAVDVSGWSVQYASAAGTTWTNSTALTGSVPAHGFYLVAEAGSSNGADLPAADVTGTINLSAGSGRVALVRASAALTCGAACASDPSVVDFVGYGATNDAAGGHAAPGLSNSTSAQRVLDPFTNTGDNAHDFTAAAPTPKAPPVAAPTGSDCSATPLPEVCKPGPLTIQGVQGDGFLSPEAGKDVTRVPGVVTAVRTTGSSAGFWMQDPSPDLSRTSASSGIFVFRGTGVAVGDSVLVTGKVTEYYPGSDPVATTASLSTTELTPTTITTVSKGNALPAPLTLTATTVPDRYAPEGVTGNIEQLAKVDPTASALEFWEAHEGMLVQVDDARVVGPGKAQYGEIYLTTKPDQHATPRGGTYVTNYEMPSGRVLVAPVTGTVPAANVGDVLKGSTVGPVDWSTFGGYDIAATQVGSWHDNGLQPTVATAQAKDQLAIATYNVENLAPGDPATKFSRLGRGVVENLASPDIVCVEEIQDNSGATDDGTVAADLTLGKLTAAIKDAGGPAYQWSEIDPVNDQDGGQPGGNIRVAFLYNPDRVSFDAKAGGDATTAVTVSRGADGTASLSASPGRIDPTNEAWTSSRKPLAGEFTFGGKKVIVVANHFNSKGGDQSADGRFQPPTRSSEVQRVKQATVVNGFVKQVLAADPTASLVLAGDFNDYQFSPAIKTLTDDGATLTDLINTLPENERYTYNYNGVSQVLDHIFTSKALRDVQYDVIHVNSEFADQASDHDPQVVRIRPGSTTATLNLININDFHGRIDANTVKFAGTVEQLRAAGGESNTLFLAAGDNVGASLFASASQQDQPTIDVLNALGMNASSVGNHEFDTGYDDLTNRIMKAAHWNYLGANVYKKGTTTPALPEYAIFDVDGLRVGVIGAVTDEAPSLVSPAGIANLDFGDPVAAVNRVAAQLTDGDPANGEADVLIAEYHEGASEGTPDGATFEQEMAAGGAFAHLVNDTSAKVSVLFTGHTHKEYAWDAPVPGQAGKTRPVLQTGDYGENVGNVVLTVDRASNAVVSYTSRNVPRTTTDDATLVATYPRVGQVKSIIDAALAKAKEIGDQPVGKVTADITTAFVDGKRDDRSSESTLGNLVANALRDELSSADRGGAQIGVVNPGGLRDELRYGTDGTITYAQANAVLPFVNNLWTLSLTGAQFKQVLEQMWQPDGSSRPFLNLGLSDNVSYTYDPAAARGQHITSVTVNGAPLDPAASYRIGTFSFLATGGDNFTEFRNATNVKDTGLVDRDAWIHYIGKHSPLSPSFARRGVTMPALPASVGGGDTVKFTVGKLDLTSLGSPANTTVTATLGGKAVGNFPVTTGAADVSFTVPDGLSGTQPLTLVAGPSGTTVQVWLSVTPKATTHGTIWMLTPRTLAGLPALALLTGFERGEKLTIALDGKQVSSVRTGLLGEALIVVPVPVKAAAGTHTITVTTAKGASVSASFQVVRW